MNQSNQNNITSNYESVILKDDLLKMYIEESPNNLSNKINTFSNLVENNFFRNNIKTDKIVLNENLEEIFNKFQNNFNQFTGKKFENISDFNNIENTENSKYLNLILFYLLSNKELFRDINSLNEKMFTSVMYLETADNFLKDFIQIFENILFIFEHKFISSLNFQENHLNIKQNSEKNNDLQTQDIFEVNVLNNNLNSINENLFNLNNQNNFLLKKKKKKKW